MFLILTEAGKPVYSSSQSQKTPEFCGVLATIFEYFLQQDSKILSFGGKRDKFVFLKRNSLIFTIFTKADEAVGRNYLKLLSDLLISHFTNYSLKRILEERPNYDLSHAVSGIKGFIENSLGSMQSLLRLEDALPVLRVPKAIRESIKSVFAQTKAKGILFSMLFSDRKIIMTKRLKNLTLFPSDLILVLENISVASIQAIEDVQLWMPICLPKFDKNRFLYLYGVFLDRKLGLACLSQDKEGFLNCSRFSKEIIQKLSHLKEMKDLATSIRSDSFHLVEIGIPGLLHFAFKSKQFYQLMMPKNSPPYSYKQDWKRLLLKYQSLCIKLQHSGVNWVFQKWENEAILASQTSTHEIYIVLGPLATLEVALDVHSRLLSWLKLEHDSLFLVSSPVF